MIVIDASVATKWFVEEEGHAFALSLLEKRLAIAVPDWIFAETANVLWKKLRRSEVTLEQAMQACRALPNYVQTIISSTTLVAESLNLASRLDHPVYDCLYVVCAPNYGGKLVTADQKFIARLKNSSLAELVVALDDSAAISRLISANDFSDVPDDPKTQPET